VDIASLSGILAAFCVALGAVLLGSAPRSMVDLPSLLFVLGGTCAIAVLTFPMEDLRQTIRASIRAFASRKISAWETVAAMVHLAEISRKEGIMALEKIHSPNPILGKAARLVADNADPDLIRSTLNMELLALQKRYDICTAVLSRLAACAPAVGMLGTLAGLAQMLTGLKNPDAFGPPLAASLMATFYGCLLSTLVFLPIAGRLKIRSMRTELRLNIIFEGVRCILENNNPGLVHERLSSFLPPEARQ